MEVVTIDGVDVAYDASADVEIVSDVDGVDVAWQEAEAVEEYIPQVIMVM